ncbi:MAG: IPTL-CTERM sorting domain-containing protein [Candidatus Binatia bacterium]
MSAPLTDNLPTGLVIANPTNASTTCGGGSTVSATAGGTAVTLPTGRTIPAAIGTTAGTCTVTVNVTSVTAGSYLNTLAADALQTTENGSNAAPVVTTLTVTPRLAAAPTPTLSGWGLMVLTALLAVVAFAAVRRQAM